MRTTNAQCVASIRHFAAIRLVRVRVRDDHEARRRGRRRARRRAAARRPSIAWRPRTAQACRRPRPSPDREDGASERQARTQREQLRRPARRAAERRGIDGASSGSRAIERRTAGQRLDVRSPRSRRDDDRPRAAASRRSICRRGDQADGLDRSDPAAERVRLSGGARARARWPRASAHKNPGPVDSQVTTTEPGRVGADRADARES